jgi:hypothetical protein
MAQFTAFGSAAERRRPVTTLMFLPPVDINAASARPAVMPVRTLRNRSPMPKYKRRPAMGEYGAIAELIVWYTAPV